MKKYIFFLILFIYPVLACSGEIDVNKLDVGKEYFDDICKGVQKDLSIGNKGPLILKLFNILSSYSKKDTNFTFNDARDYAGDPDLIYVAKKETTYIYYYTDEFDQESVIFVWTEHGKITEVGSNVASVNDLSSFSKFSSIESV